MQYTDACDDIALLVRGHKIRMARMQKEHGEWMARKRCEQAEMILGWRVTDAKIARLVERAALLLLGASAGIAIKAVLL